jgi:exodeoxyribonuclease VII small subunit
MKETKPTNFEEAFKKLQEMVTKLESGGNLPLDEAMTSYELGVTQAKICEEILKEAEKKISVYEKNTSHQSGDKS